MDRAMNVEASRVYVIIRFHHDATVEIDLHHARRRNLFEHHAVRIDQEVMLRPGHARRDVCEDEIIPAVNGDETIGRREIHTDLPVFRRNKFSHVQRCCFLSRTHTLSFPGNFKIDCQPESSRRIAATSSSRSSLNLSLSRRGYVSRSLKRLRCSSTKIFCFQIDGIAECCPFSQNGTSNRSTFTAPGISISSVSSPVTSPT